MPIKTVIEAEEIIKDLEIALRCTSHGKGENRYPLTDKELDLKLKISKQRMALEQYLKEIYNNSFPRVIVEIPISETPDKSDITNVFNISKEIISKYPNISKIALNFKMPLSPDSEQYKTLQSANFSLYFDTLDVKYSNSLKLLNLNNISYESFKELANKLASRFTLPFFRELHIDSPSENSLEKSISLGSHILLKDILNLIEQGITKIEPPIIYSNEIALTYKNMPTLSFYELEKINNNFNDIHEKISFFRYDTFD